MSVRDRTPAAFSALYSPRLWPAQKSNAHVFALEHGQAGQIDGGHGRLKVDRLGQLLHRALETQPRYVDPRDVLHHVEDFAHEIELLIQVRPHADGLGPLAGE